MTPETPSADPYAGLPETWSDSARETYAQIDEESPNATAAQRSALFEAVSLIALADELEATLVENGHMTTGSKGQLVVNPAISEVRALRRDAFAILRTAGVGVTKAATAASAAGAALVANRWTRR